MIWGHLIICAFEMAKLRCPDKIVSYTEGKKLISVISLKLPVSQSTQSRSHQAMSVLSFVLALCECCHCMG